MQLILMGAAFHKKRFLSPGQTELLMVQVFEKKREFEFCLAVLTYD